MLLPLPLLLPRSPLIMATDYHCKTRLNVLNAVPLSEKAMPLV